MWISILMLLIILALVVLVGAVVVVGMQGRYQDKFGDEVTHQLSDAAKYLNGEKEYPDVVLPRLSRR